MYYGILPVRGGGGTTDVSSLRPIFRYDAYPPICMCYIQTFSNHFNDGSVFFIMCFKRNDLGLSNVVDSILLMLLRDPNIPHPILI